LCDADRAVDNDMPTYSLKREQYAAHWRAISASIYRGGRVLLMNISPRCYHFYLLSRSALRIWASIATTNIIIKTGVFVAER